MAFNPQVQDRRAEIIANAANQQSDIKMQGALAVANNVKSVGASLGGAIGNAVSSWKQSAQQQSSNAGTLAGYAAINDEAKAKTGSGIVSDEFFASVAGEKNKDKQSAMLMTVKPQVESYVSTQRQIAVANAQGVFSPTYMDVGGVGMVETSPGSWSVVGRGGASKQTPTFSVSVPNGVNIYGGTENGR